MRVLIPRTALLASLHVPGRRCPVADLTSDFPGYSSDLNLPFCTLGEGSQHSPACHRRVVMANHAMELCHQAVVTLDALKRSHVARYEQLDLLSEPVSDELIAVWWGVHRACGQEYRRLVALFWKRCPHGQEQAKA